MAASVITRATLTDDDGSGTVGTIVDAALIGSAIYDKIDQLLSGTGAYATLTIGGNLVSTNNLTAQQSIIGTLGTLLAGSGSGGYTGALRGVEETLQGVAIASGTPSADLAKGSHLVLTVSQNITSITLTHSALSIVDSLNLFKVRFHLINDGTARTITWTINGNAVKWPGGVTPTMTGTNLKRDIFEITYIPGDALYGQVIGQNY